MTASGDAAHGGLSIALGPEATLGHSTFENRGTLVKTAGTGQLTVDGISFVNYGTINGASGSIVLTTVGLGPELLEAGSTLQGSIAASCEVSLVGTSSVAASSTFEISRDAAGHLGVLDGSGALGGAGTVMFDSSQINATGTNTITFAAGGDVALPPNTNSGATTFSIDAQAAIIFAGTTRWTGGLLEIGTGSMTNSGSWVVTAPGTLSAGSAGATLANTGTFTCDPGSGAVQLQALVTSGGAFVAKSGTLFFGGNGRPELHADQRHDDACGRCASCRVTLSWGRPVTRACRRRSRYGIDIKGRERSPASGTIDTRVSNEGTVAPGRRCSRARCPDHADATPRARGGGPEARRARRNAGGKRLRCSAPWRVTRWPRGA